MTAAAVSNLGDGVSQVAMPILAAAITKDALLVAVIAVLRHLPWLLVSLPAGVAADRFDRRRLMLAANSARFGITVIVALAVATQPQDEWLERLSRPVTTAHALYLLLAASTLVLGVAEVVYDTSAQSLLPAIVAPEALARANARLWTVEAVCNYLLGPGLAAVLIAAQLPLAFAFDALSFLLAGLVILRLQTPVQVMSSRASWWADAKQGIRWLREHRTLRTLLFSVALVNGASMATMAVYPLFVFEVLDAGPFQFAVLTSGAAVGAIAGGLAAEFISARLGPGRSLALSFGGVGGVSLLVASVSSWHLALILFIAIDVLAVLLNVVSVSYRQAAVPRHLIGRVNGAYRLAARGALPIGALLGGLVVAAAQPTLGRAGALRVPWIVAGCVELAVCAVALRRLTNHSFSKGASEP